MGIREKLGPLARKEPQPHGGILDHYRTFWGSDRIEEVHWTPEHLGERLPDFHIVKVRPETPDGMWTFASIGAWRATAQAHHGLEFVAVAHDQSAAVMQRLGMIAYYHAGPPENRLGIGHLLPIGGGWVEGSPLESILVSLPYPWGPRLEHCQLPGRHIQVAWLLPITTAEHQFAREHGADALEGLFDESKLNYVDPFRQSVV
jgi:hypothetical protein